MPKNEVFDIMIKIQKGFFLQNLLFLMKRKENLVRNTL